MNILNNKVEFLMIYPFTIADPLGVQEEEKFEVKRLR